MSNRETPTLQRGDRVRILSGAFIGMEGTIVSPEAVQAANPKNVPGRDVREGTCNFMIIRIFNADLPVIIPTHQLVHTS
jgi:transcription antitermination factor NusG